MRQNIISGHLFIKVNGPISVVAKVCEHLGLAVNLKMDLESGVFNQWEDNQVLSDHSDLFKEQGSIKVWLSQHMLVDVYYGTNKGDF